MKIKELELINIGGIQKLKLENFDPSMNIICGPNGIGKTTLIDSIAHIFSSGYTNVLKRNVNSQHGSINFKIEAIEDSETNISTSSIYIDVYNPNLGCGINTLYQYSNKLIHLKTNRTFIYENLSAILKDEVVDLSRAADSAVSGIFHHTSKSWFIHKFVFSNLPNSLKEEQLHNFDLAKRSFSLLNKEFSFETVDPDSLEIIIKTPSGNIIYEYLSSGFKSIISIIFGIIREIEFRFQDKKIKAEDFDGIILIDEIELHLHPEWQAKVSNILKQIFPSAQFILTTHSPHVVQTALKGEVIALERDGNDVKQRDLVDQEYGYLGWTIEEVLKYVMGMGSLKTDEYNNTREVFMTAFKNQDFPTAHNAFNKLKQMLHPESELIEIYKMQLLSLGD